MKKILKRIKEYIVGSLQYTAHFFGYKIIKTKTSLNPRFQHILPFLFLKNPDDFFFVQIGANDGKTNDPLYDFITRYRPRGVLVEPQKEVFDRLKATYGGYEGLEFANVALAQNDGKRNLYVVKDDFQTILNKHRKWGGDSTAIASFSKEQLVKSLERNMKTFFETHKPEDYITTVDVPTMTFASLVGTYNIKRIDLLQVDVEGYDYEVIKMFDFETFLPSVINYESKHLSETDKSACQDLLAEKGYTLVEYEGDTCAFRI